MGHLAQTNFGRLMTCSDFYLRARESFLVVPPKRKMHTCISSVCLMGSFFLIFFHHFPLAEDGNTQSSWKLPFKSAIQLTFGLLIALVDLPCFLCGWVTFSSGKTSKLH